MKSIVLSLFTLLSATTIAHANATAKSAGPQGSGGGKGVVCRDTHGKIKSAELLDLWEGENLYGRKVIKSNAPVATQVTNAIAALKNAVYNSNGYWSHGHSADDTEYFVNAISDTSEFFLKPNQTAHWVTNVTLAQTPDSFEQAQPTDCGIEQIVTYDDSVANPNIIINKDLWDRLDVTNRAALIIHESLYAFLRLDSDEPNSLRVRRSVGYIFAGNVFAPITSIVSKNALSCNTISEAGNPLEFVIDTDAEGKSDIIPLTINGQAAIGFFDPPADHKTGLNVLSVMTADPTCAPQGSTTTPDNPSRAVEALSFTSWSPIDLDLKGVVLFACEGGKRVAYLPPSNWWGWIDQTPPAGSVKAFCFPLNMSTK